MIVGTANINLYGALSIDAAECFAAKQALDAAGLQYTHLFYTEPEQQADVLAAISTWYPHLPALTAFPFVVYDERHDDYSVERRIIVGKDAILAAIDDEVLT